MAEEENVAVADLLAYSDDEIAELMRERSAGITSRKRIEKEIRALRQAESHIKSAQGLEQKGNMKEALAKYHQPMLTVRTFVSDG